MHTCLEVAVNVADDVAGGEGARTLVLLAEQQIHLGVQRQHQLPHGVGAVGEQPLRLLVGALLRVELVHQAEEDVAHGVAVEDKVHGVEGGAEDVRAGGGPVHHQNGIDDAAVLDLDAVHRQGVLLLLAGGTLA